MKVLSAETNLSSATNVSSASVVRIFNSDSSATTVTKKDSGGSTIGTFTILANTSEMLEKNPTNIVFVNAGTDVLGAKVGYTN